MSGRLEALFDEYLCWAYAGTRAEPYCNELRQIHHHVPESDAEALLAGMREVLLMHNILRSESNIPAAQSKEKLHVLMERMSRDSTIADKL